MIYFHSVVDFIYMQYFSWLLHSQCLLYHIKMYMYIENTILYFEERNSLHLNRWEEYLMIIEEYFCQFSAEEIRCVFDDI